MYHRSGREVHRKNKEETIIGTLMPLVTAKRNVIADYYRLVLLMTGETEPRMANRDKYQEVTNDSCREEANQNTQKKW